MQLILYTWRHHFDSIVKGQFYLFCSNAAEQVIHQSGSIPGCPSPPAKVSLGKILNSEMSWHPMDLFGVLILFVCVCV